MELLCQECFRVNRGKVGFCVAIYSPFFFDHFVTYITSFCNICYILTTFFETIADPKLSLFYFCPVHDPISGSAGVQPVTRSGRSELFFH